MKSADAKDVLPCSGCKGMCCGPVPVTEQELKAIRKKVRAMPGKSRQELENQTRFYGTCIFYDQTNDRCGIHAVRPGVCRAFGLHRNLVCYRKPDAATGTSWQPREQAVGILSTDFTWKDFK
ncbi:YkgJ family cysteine cluster protein [Paenibacillus athensensis]|nr:YkgJ family cysteine cluster protein [Paenibacillus athensensis]